jgi:hypothetical protein
MREKYNASQYTVFALVLTNEKAYSDHANVFWLISKVIMAW